MQPGLIEATLSRQQTFDRAYWEHDYRPDEPEYGRTHERPFGHILNHLTAYVEPSYWEFYGDFIAAGDTTRLEESVVPDLLGYGLKLFDRLEWDSTQKAALLAEIERLERDLGYVFHLDTKSTNSFYQVTIPGMIGIARKHLSMYLEPEGHRVTGIRADLDTSECNTEGIRERTIPILLALASWLAEHHGIDPSRAFETRLAELEAQQTEVGK